ncbi:MAG: S1 RNA-binding domain-containing protein, partial [Actinomycetia bacterium]|nr:S1 RNA-binding domain-containing protein [Actinomycetes bacterium]
KYAPRIITIKVDKDKIRDIIGPGGKTIHSIIDETGASIDIEQDGTVYIASKEELGAEKAKEIIENLTKDVKVGETYMGKVMRVVNFGAFVEILPGKEGLVHISKLSSKRISSVEDFIKVGDSIMVKVVEIDSMKRINLASAEYLESFGGDRDRNDRNRR